MASAPYNPLDKLNLARSIEAEILSRPAVPLKSIREVQGAGVYVIYYVGRFQPYEPIARANESGKFECPIYVGKAIPKGGRKGGISLESSTKGTPLVDRLRQHASSIEEVANLDIDDFFARHLVVDDIWIPLGENMLIEKFKPIWNRAIDGFGNKDPGRRRATQFRSPWDVLHPGRAFASKLADSSMTQAFLVERVSDYLAGRPMKRLPKAIVEQEAADSDTE